MSQLSGDAAGGSQLFGLKELGLLVFEEGLALFEGEDHGIKLTGEQSDIIVSFEAQEGGGVSFANSYNSLMQSTDGAQVANRDDGSQEADEDGEEGEGDDEDAVFLFSVLGFGEAEEDMVGEGILQGLEIILKGNLLFLQLVKGLFEVKFLTSLCNFREYIFGISLISGITFAGLFKAVCEVFEGHFFGVRSKGEGCLGSIFGLIEFGKDGAWEIHEGEASQLLLEGQVSFFCQEGGFFLIGVVEGLDVGSYFGQLQIAVAQQLDFYLVLSNCEDADEGNCARSEEDCGEAD